METDEWVTRLLRITKHDADDLDDLLSDFDSRRMPEGRDIFPPLEAAFFRSLELRRTDAIVVGIRAETLLPDAADVAVRLASLAIERDVHVVVLADVETTGLERFGFRVERIAGDTDAARAACLDQLRRFWNIDLLL